MRPLAFLLLLLSCCLLHAQEQERKLIDRVLQPDNTLANPMQNMAYNSGGGKGLDTTKSADVKEFSFQQKFSPKTFETKDFQSKGYWQGEMQFATKNAPVKTNSNADKVFDVKTAPVKDYRDNNKLYDTKGYTTREAVEKGKTSQQHLQDENLKGQMNMDQIRSLLNKMH